MLLLLFLITACPSPTLNAALITISAFWWMHSPRPFTNLIYNLLCIVEKQTEMTVIRHGVMHASFNPEFFKAMMLYVGTSAD